MHANWQQLLDTLQTLPVDTSAQQDLIRAAAIGAEQPAILIVGTEEADPYSLIPGGNPFAGIIAPACPVKCCYGEQFSILVDMQQGETERFHTIEDYQAFYGSDAGSIKACTVYSPQADPAWPPLLFCTPDAGDPHQLRRLAAMADGCIFTAYAEAGSVGEAAVELSRMMQQDRCVLVLTHVENTFFPNDMLSLQLYDGRLLCMECDHTLTGKGGPLSTLRNALEVIGAVPPTSFAAKYVALAHAEANQQMDAHVQAARDKHNKLLAAVHQYEEAEHIFRAEASTRRYEIRGMVSDEQCRGLQKDLSALVEDLKQQLPEMIDEVVDECDRPKDALKNLLAEYVSSTLNDALTAALKELMDEQYLPQVNRIMQDTMDDYTRLATVALQSLQDEDSEVDEAFMQITHLHLGEFHTPLASFISDRLYHLLFRLTLYSEFSFLAGAVMRLKGVIKEFVSDSVDLLVPAKAYGKSLSKAVIKELDTILESLLEQIQSSLFPRLIEVLDDEYASFIDECAQQLTSAADRLRQQAQAAQEELALCEQSAMTCRQAYKGD